MSNKLNAAEKEHQAISDLHDLLNGDEQMKESFAKLINEIQKENNNIEKSKQKIAKAKADLKMLTSNNSKAVGIVLKNLQVPHLVKDLHKRTEKVVGVTVDEVIAACVKHGNPSLINYINNRENNRKIVSDVIKSKQEDDETNNDNESSEEN